MQNQTMLMLLLICIGGLFSGCSNHQEQNSNILREDRFETTNSLIAQSQKDGVFLASCAITPNIVTAGDSFLLNIHQAFIEQRFSAGAETGKVELMDSLILHPKLVIITKKSRLDDLWVGTAFIQQRTVPYNLASGMGSNIIVLNLLPEDVSQRFALHLQIKNKRGQYEDYNLTVTPQPIVQTLDESYNSSLAQSREDGLLLATCVIMPSSVGIDSFKLSIKEAFIEHRFLVGARTHQVQRLDSVRVRPRLILVANSDSKLGPISANWQMILPDGGQISGYREAEKVVAFDLPEGNLQRKFILELRIKNKQGSFKTHSLQVQPTAAPPSQEAAAAPWVEPTSTLNQGGFEESFPVFNASADAARKAGMLLATCQAAPTAIAVEDRFRLAIDQVFIEQPASRTAVTKRLSLDTTNAAWPRLMLKYLPNSRLGKLGVDWDMHLQNDAHNLVYQIAQQRNILVFRLAPPDVHKRIAICLKVKNKLGVFEEHLLELRPVSIEAK